MMANNPRVKGANKHKTVHWSNPDDTGHNIPVEDVHEYQDETFYDIATRVRQKQACGATLTPKEKWAAKSMLQAPKGYKWGARKQTVQKMKDIVRLQLEEGLNQSQISEKLGYKGANSVSQLIARNPDAYQRALTELQDEVLRESGVRKSLVYARILSLMAKPALRAVSVVESVMDDAEQPGGVRVQAAEKMLKGFGVGTPNPPEAPPERQLSEESKRMLSDTIGIMGQLVNSFRGQTVDALDAEIVEAQPSLEAEGKFSTSRKEQNDAGK